MTKRILNLFTVLVMTVSLAGVLPAVTAGAESSGDYEYTVLDDDTVEITGYTGSETELEIPSEIDGKAVTSIGYSAFRMCESLISITVPDGVISIGIDAFWNCLNLTSITIPDSVESIGDWAFGFCYSLTEINVDSNNTNYSSEYGVLFNYDKTELIQYPIGNIQTTYTIPKSVAYIYSGAFEDCIGLTEINVDSNNENYSSQDGVLFDYEKTELIQYPIGKTQTTYTIPNSVTVIGESAFSDCESLTSIIIPNSVTNIEVSAFAYCESLTSITIPNSVTSIEESAFDGCEALTIKCYQDSYAEQYAKENNIKYELIADNNPPTSTDNSSNTQTPNNNSNKPNQTVSPVNKAKTPSTTKVSVTKPAKVKAVKLTAKKKKLNVSWKKVSGATGYEVKYATNNKFTKGKKTVTVKKNKVTLKRLKSKKKYFVKVRAYKLASGRKYFGKWSKVVKKKTK